MSAYERLDLDDDTLRQAQNHCEECQVGYIVNTGDLDPRGIYAVCSNPECDWTA